MMILLKSESRYYEDYKFSNGQTRQQYRTFWQDNPGHVLGN